MSLVIRCCGQAVRAGLPDGVSPHWMRHAHISHALDRGAPGHLRQALALLAAWQDDALSAAELGALSAAQRIARQAQTETRTAALARIVRRLLITQGLDQ